MPRYIDPLTDFGFKRLFGSEPNKDLLIAFLNGIFSGRRTILDLEYKNKELLGDSSDQGVALLDLLCSDSAGDYFLIEVQRGRVQNFMDRATFYSSRLISEQAPKGNRAHWNYALKGVYFIALLDAPPLDVTTGGDYLTDMIVCERNRPLVIYDKLEFIYLELRNFVKKEADLETDLDRWLYLLKHMSELEKLPVYLHGSIFVKLFNLAEYSKLTKENITMYDVSQKRRWDEHSMREAAVMEGMEKGIELGILQVARDMKKKGLAVEIISAVTKLSEEEIAKL